ncbi:MAG: hypothetical protein WAN11_24030 [Syntrophobacteraceae bacterium]
MDSRESTSPNDRLVLLTSLSYEAKMKGTAFVFMVFISGLLLAGLPARLASNSEGPGPLKIQSLQNRISPAHRLLLADRTDTKDSITYGTDPDMERAMEEQAREEKEKEDKAWNMLQHMQLYKDNGKPSRPAQPNNTPPQ